MGDYPQKTLENRQKELKTYKKEIQTRKLALESKKAGAEIETFERERVKRNLASVRLRIHNYNDDALNKASSILSRIHKDKRDKLSSIETSWGHQFFDIYKSIKLDLKDSLKDKGSKIENLFPNRKIDFESAIAFVSSLQNIVKEFIDIINYLERYK